MTEGQWDPAQDEIVQRARQLRVKMIQTLVALPRMWLDSLPPWSIVFSELFGRRLVNAPSAGYEVVLKDRETGEVVAPARPALWTPVPPAEATVDEMLARRFEVRARYSIAAVFVDAEGRVPRVERVPYGWRQVSYDEASATEKEVDASESCRPRRPAVFSIRGLAWLFRAYNQWAAGTGQPPYSMLIAYTGVVCWTAENGDRICQPGHAVVVVSGGYEGTWRTLIGNYESVANYTDVYIMTDCLEARLRYG